MIAAAAALDRARAAAVSIAAVLARHHPVPATGTVMSRYLGAGTRTLLSTSWRADPTTPLGLAEATSAVITLLRQARYTTRHVLGTELTWPWQQLTACLRPLLGDNADLAPRPAHADALYNAELALRYDHHRPIAAEMATGLRTLAQRWLHHAVVLELGAGTGRITAHLAGDATRYLAVEYSPAMARQLTTRAIPNITILLGDAHHVPAENNSVDVIVEHETLSFTDAPAKVIEEVQRVLRPGGLLVRILVHPLGVDPGASVETAYRATAFASGPGPLFTGKGTDALLTDLLARRGWATHEHTLATWERTRTPCDVLAPLADRAWPYLHQANPEQHAAGMAAAHRAATHAAGPDGMLRCFHRLYLYALVTRIGDPS
jgi:SAM-dependent methyltransferase